jgi:hypothetical protein
MKIMSYKRIDKAGCESIEKFIDCLKKAVEEVDAANPNWREERNYFYITEDIDDAYYSHITMYYMREETPEEQERRERNKDLSIQREKDTLKRLMEKYPEEVQKKLK